MVRVSQTVFHSRLGNNEDRYDVNVVWFICSFILIEFLNRGSFPPVSPKYSYELRSLINHLFKRNPRYVQDVLLVIDHFHSFGKIYSCRFDTIIKLDYRMWFLVTNFLRFDFTLKLSLVWMISVKNNRLVWHLKFRIVILCVWLTRTSRPTQNLFNIVIIFNYRDRPSISAVLRKPVLTARIKKFLSERVSFWI